MGNKPPKSPEQPVDIDPQFSIPIIRTGQSTFEIAMKLPEQVDYRDQFEFNVPWVHTPMFWHRFTRYAKEEYIHDKGDHFFNEFTLYQKQWSDNFYVCESMIARGICLIDNDIRLNRHSNPEFHPSLRYLLYTCENKTRSLRDIVYFLVHRHPHPYAREYSPSFAAGVILMYYFYRHLMIRCKDNPENLQKQDLEIFIDQQDWEIYTDNQSCKGVRPFAAKGMDVNKIEDSVYKVLCYVYRDLVDISRETERSYRVEIYQSAIQRPHIDSYSAMSLNEWKENLYESVFQRKYVHGQNGFDEESAGSKLYNVATTWPPWPRERNDYYDPPQEEIRHYSTTPSRRNRDDVTVEQRFTLFVSRYVFRENVTFDDREWWETLYHDLLNRDSIDLIDILPPLTRLRKLCGYFDWFNPVMMYALYRNSSRDQKLDDRQVQSLYRFICGYDFVFCDTTSRMHKLSLEEVHFAFQEKYVHRARNYLSSQDQGELDRITQFYSNPDPKFHQSCKFIIESYRLKDLFVNRNQPSGVTKETAFLLAFLTWLKPSGEGLDTEEYNEMVKFYNHTTIKLNKLIYLNRLCHTHCVT